MHKFLATLAVASTMLAMPALAHIEQAEVTGGTIQGTAEDGLSVFRGIPYAAAPTGDLRWAPPAPVIPWQGVKLTDRFGDACMQGFDMLRQQGSAAAMSEDCLFLDVWSPAASAEEKLPVIVWIHGGGYTMGATSVGLYDGANFARDGVVFVSVGYRLGSFGFLATPELSAESGRGSGNAGMLDMVQALQWVQDNIDQFGGDPDRVTIMGHSAGSSAVSILTASDLTKGMIDGVIAESGANFAPLMSERFAGGGLLTLATAERGGSEWLQSLGASTLAKARALPAATLLDAQTNAASPGWRPATDGYVLADDQYRLWEQGRFNDIPLLIGTTSNEWGSRAQPGDFAAMVREDYGDFADRIIAAYAPTGSEAARLLGNESGMESNAYTWASLHDRYGESPVYYYWFDNAEGGSGHGSEVALVFGNEDLRPGRTSWDDRTRALSRQLHSYWVNFAKTGNPNGGDLYAWPVWTPDEPSVLAVGLDTRVRDVAGRERLDTWAEYFAWRREQQ